MGIDGRVVTQELVDDVWKDIGGSLDINTKGANYGIIKFAKETIPNTDNGYGNSVVVYKKDLKDLLPKLDLYESTWYNRKEKFTYRAEFIRELTDDNRLVIRFF